MGLLNQLIRGFKQLLRNLFRSRKKDEPIKIPESWAKPEKPEKKTLQADIIIKHRTRIPHLKKINRILAGFMLLFNLIFSQFLLGSIGTGAQPMFLFFLLNSYIIFRYLWITRKKEGLD